MSNVQVLLPSTSLNPLVGASPNDGGAQRPSSAGGSHFPPQLVLRRPRDSESDSPQPKKLQKPTRRRRKKKPPKRQKKHGPLRKIASNGGKGLRPPRRNKSHHRPGGGHGLLLQRMMMVKPYAPFNSNQYLMDNCYPQMDNYYPNITNSSSEADPTESRARAEFSCRPLNNSAINRSDEDVLWFAAALDSADEHSFSSTASQPEVYERLDQLTKEQLVEKYLSLEDELSTLTSRLVEVRETDRRMNMVDRPSPGGGEDEDELPPGEVQLTVETAAKISVFNREISTLQLENGQLREDHAKRRLRSRSNSSSSSSSSDSSDSWTSSSSSSDDSSETEAVTRENDTTARVSPKRRLCAEDKLDDKHLLGKKTPRLSPQHSPGSVPTANNRDLSDDNNDALSRSSPPASTPPLQSAVTGPQDAISGAGEASPTNSRARLPSPQQQQLCGSDGNSNSCISSPAVLNLIEQDQQQLISSGGSLSTDFSAAEETREQLTPSPPPSTAEDITTQKDGEDCGKLIPLVNNISNNNNSISDTNLVIDTCENYQSDGEQNVASSEASESKNCVVDESFNNTSVRVVCDAKVLTPVYNKMPSNDDSAMNVGAKENVLIPAVLMCNGDHSITLQADNTADIRVDNGRQKMGSSVGLSISDEILLSADAATS